MSTKICPEIYQDAVPGIFHYKRKLFWRKLKEVVTTHGHAWESIDNSDKT
jgi:hypothetical protein